MSADSIYAGVEREMKRRPGSNVYHFCDFVEAVGSSNSRKMVVIEPKANEFRNWAKLQSQSKIRRNPKLSEMKVVQFNRGSIMLHYKLIHTDPEFHQLDFLKKRADISIIPGPIRRKPRGVPAVKKKEYPSSISPIYANIQEKILARYRRG